MPLLYSIDGKTLVYEPANAVNPASPAFAAILTTEMKKEAPPKFVPNAAVETYSKEVVKGAVSERKPVLLAKDIMTKTVHCAFENDSLLEARDKMQEKEIRHLPVLNANKQMSGMLSDRDVLRAGYQLDFPVSTKMTRKVLTATPDTPIQAIAEAMLLNRIHALPIIDKAHNVIGILTTTDILRAIVKHAPVDLWI